MSEVKLSVVLDKAADLLEEHGWQQGEGWGLANEGEGRRLCLEGAILAASGIPAEHGIAATSEANTCPAGRAVRSFLASQGLFTAEYSPFFVGTSLYAYNDIIGRTQAEVVGVLRGAAAAERAKEAFKSFDLVGSGL